MGQVNSGRDDGFVVAEIRATTVSVPLEAPLRHAIGSHWRRFVRTVVEVVTKDGMVGLGELGGGGLSSEDAVRGLLPLIEGMSPFDVETLRFRICNPTASLYNNRAQLHAALEFAFLDLQGQRLGVPVHDLLGGRVRDRVPFASYLFYRYGHPKTGEHEVRTVEQLVEHARDLKARHGFTSHKLKGGVFHPEYEIDGYLALADAFPDDSLRYDPNAALSVEQSLRVADRIAGCRNDFLEDPTWGLQGMKSVRREGLLLATNTVVVNFEQLAANVLDRCVDVILLDTTFWGGIRPCIKAAGVCETFQLPVAVHSSGELGIQLATMLHLGAVLPALTYTADAHYHHLLDDVVEGGLRSFEDGTIAVPTSPGLGVTLDRDRLARYAEAYRRLGGYPYDRDPGRPGWFPLVPNTSWADPDDAVRPDDAGLDWDGVGTR
jgi:glucarate dehydratase